MTQTPIRPPLSEGSEVFDGWDVSVSDPREGLLFWPQARRDAAFRQLYTIYPSDPVAHGARVRPLLQGSALAIPGARDTVAWIRAYMDEYRVAGVLVLKDGLVRLRQYGLEFGPNQRWESFSIAKSVTALLAGAALQHGYIRAMDDTVDTYVPELSGSAYASVTVRQLLTMTSGVRWNEDYADPDSDVARKDCGVCTAGQTRVVAYVRTLPRAWPAGTRWHYNTAESDLLGIVVQRATRRSLATWLSQTIWQPYGMAADAYWIKDDCDGSSTGGSGISATLDDYGRLGQFVLDGCYAGKQPVLAADWREYALSLRVGVDAEHRVRGYHGYGYQWWINADGTCFAVGIFGQMIHVDRSRGLVVVQLASWPHPNAGKLNAARSALTAAITQAVDVES